MVIKLITDNKMIIINSYVCIRCGFASKKSVFVQNVLGFKALQCQYQIFDWNLFLLSKLVLNSLV